MNRAPILIPMTLLMSVSLVAATAADASPQPGERTEAVRYGDLDLTTPSGVRALDSRINQAITRVCNRGDVRDLQSAMEESRCRSDARHAVNPQRGQALASANGGSIQLSARR